MDSEMRDRMPTPDQLVLMRCINMALESAVCPNSKPDELIKAIVYSHEHGYLYTNRKANAFVCGYRIPEVSDKWSSTIPEKETGEIFYINFAVSKDINNWVLLKMLRDYLRDNPDVKELVYFRRNNDKDFKRIHLRRPTHVKI